MRAQRQSILEENQEVNRWLVSYADLMTLLFAFFVVMYAVSQVNEVKYKQLTDSLVQAFDTPFKSFKLIQIGEVNRSEQAISGDDLQQPEVPPETQPEMRESGNLQAENFASTEEFKDLQNGLEKSLGDLIQQGVAEINSDANWININLRSSLLFPSGSAELSNNADPLLQEVAGHLNTNEQLILVHGHTDNIPIQNERYPSNWELSSARAVAVVKMFEELSVLAPRMSVEGHAEHKPVAENKTEQGRAKNRRVVISISRKYRVTEEQKQAQQQAQKQAQNILQAADKNTVPQQKDQEPEFRVIKLPDGGIIIRGADEVEN